MLDHGLRPLIWVLVKVSAICGLLSAAGLLLLTMGLALLKTTGTDERVHWENFNEILLITAAFAVAASLLIFLSGLTAVMRRRTARTGPDDLKG